MSKTVIVGTNKTAQASSDDDDEKKQRKGKKGGRKTKKERGIRATSTRNIGARTTLFESLVLATKQTITAQKIVKHFTKLEIASKTREWAFCFCFDPRLVERWAIGLELSMVRARSHVTTISCSCCFYSNDVTCQRSLFRVALGAQIPYPSFNSSIEFSNWYNFLSV